MKKAYLFLFLVFVLLQSSFAQVITFDKSFDSFFQDDLTDVEQTTDGGYIALGSTRGFSLSPGIANLYVRKYNQFGDTLWTRAIGDTTWMYPGSIQQTNDGGYIICGSGQNPASGAYIAKLDQTGNIAWQKWYGSGEFVDWFSKVKQNPDGSYIAVGTTLKTFVPAQNEVMFTYLVKLNATGDSLWTKKIKSQTSGFQCYGYDVNITSDGGYLITANQTSGLGSGRMQSLILKTNNNGTIQWQKLYPNLEAYSGIQTIDGGYIIGGINSFLWNGNTSLYKLSTAGDTIWTKKYPGRGANSVIQTSDGGYAFTGSIISDSIISSTWPFPFYFQDLLAVKTDASGKMRFMRTYGDSIDDAGYSIKQTSDGGFVIAGVKDYIFDAGIGPLQPGPDKGLLLKINFTAQDAVLSVPRDINTESAFQLYPNPATDQTTLKISNTTFDSGPIQVKIINILGAEVESKKMVDPEITIQRGSMSAGLYLVQFVNTRSGEVLATKKLLWK